MARPIAVLLAGDLTDTAEYFNWNGYWFGWWRSGFRSDYGFAGEGRLPYPIFEAYGNHDITNGRSLVTDNIRRRNQHRLGLNLSSSGLQSSWDWGGIHFINLGLYPGERKEAHGSLDFLKSDLASLSNPRQPLVLFHQYGFDWFSTMEDWWTDSERDAYFETIKTYNVAAIFTGHWHAPGRILWNGLPAYTVGSARFGYFMVAKVVVNELIILSRDSEGWGMTWRTPLARSYLSNIGGCSTATAKNPDRFVKRWIECYNAAVPEKATNNDRC